MKEETQNEYWYCNKHTDWHGLQKRAFSAYLHQISGNKFLLHKLIELPLVILNRGGSSEEEPSTGGREQIRGLCAKTTLARLIQEWKEHKKSDEYKESIKKRHRKKQKLKGNVVLHCEKSREGIRREDDWCKSSRKDVWSGSG